jgi:hypothetical protein
MFFEALDYLLNYNTGVRQEFRGAGTTGYVGERFDEAVKQRIG